MMAGKSRKHLTLQEKLEALRMLESGRLSSAVMYKFGVSSRFVRKLKSEGAALLEEAEKQNRSLQSKSLRGAQYREIDEKVYRFVELARSCKISVTQSTIKERALLVRDEILRRNDLDDAQRKRFEHFTASVGWCVKFVRRHGIESVALHGQAASATVEEAAEDMAKLRERLREFDVNCIYNVDETGLFYKLLPRRSYVAKTEDKKTPRGTRQMAAKDRITAYVCTNADGSERLPMAIIGTAKNPRCFRLGRPPVPYFSNKTAWSTSQTFKKWFNYAFLPHVRSRTSKKVALVLDNAGSHSDLRDLREQVTIIPLPRNVTAVHQPMDMGIISTWKQMYRRYLVRELVRDIESRAERRALNRGRKGGINGLEEGYDPHILDAAKLAKLSWDNVSTMTIARCWIRSNCVPTAMSAEICATYGQMHNCSNDKEVRDVMEMLATLKINLGDDDTLRNSVDENVKLSDVEQWLDVENDGDGREALVSDIADTLEQLALETLEQETEENDVEEDVNELPMPPPSLAQVYHMFRPIQESAFSCNLPDTSAHLQRALNSFREAIRKSNATAQRQLLITEMLPRQS